MLESAPDLEEDPALIAPVTTLKTVQEDSSKEVDCGKTFQPADTVVQLLSKQATEKPINEETKSKVEEEKEEKNETEDQKLVIELLRQQVASVINLVVFKQFNIQYSPRRDPI